MKHRNLLLASTAAGLAIGGAGWFLVRKLTEPRTVTPLRVGEPFPTLAGRLLNGDALTIPDDLTGQVGLLIVAWDYAARFEVEDWGRSLLEIYGIVPDTVVLEVAMISGIGPVMRRVIDAAMARQTAEGLRSHVLTVYGDLRWLHRRLAAPADAHATVFVLGRTGRLTWRADGPPTPELQETLREALAAQGIAS